jgi:Protein of unknown function (DUF4085)
MVFFTRELYLGIQPKSGRERRAEREWDRRSDIYAKYGEVIGPLLPAPVRRLCKQGLHDGVIRKAAFKGGELVLVVDATNALSGFRGRQVRLTFRGVRGRPSISKLVGQWWLYEEAHLTSRARFSLHVLLDPSEVEIEADELIINFPPWEQGITKG